MQIDIEKAVSALAALNNASVNTIIANSVTLSAALAGGNLTATRDQIQTKQVPIVSTGGQITGWQTVAG
ncbi:hypothetical protein ACOCG7_24800 [Paraburkholderia sp. DD10]|jgi:hypothetical protein|uniref:hypothetical protein n=1 Tax=Paraburkholderia TaxID=1822464 RepID=UPI003A0AF60E